MRTQFIKQKWLLSSVLAAMMFSFTSLPLFAQEASKEIKLGTVYPKNSEVGKILDAWAKAVKDESQGKLHLTCFYGGSKGNETQLAQKIRSKELDGALLSAGLSQISPHTAALEMPGLFQSWTKLDAALTTAGPDFETQFSQQGFVLLGWTGFGQNRIMSKGFAVNKPDDLKSKNVLQLLGDVNQTFLYREIGGVNAVSAGHPEIFQKLDSGAVSVIFAPAMTAKTFDWTTKLDHVSSAVHSFSIGGIVINKETFDGLPDDVRAVLKKTGRNVIALLNTRMRKLDDAAYANLKTTMTVDDYSAEDKVLWDARFAAMRSKLKAEGKIRADVFDRIVALAK